MLDENVDIQPLSERETMQTEAGATKLPLQDLCYATWTNQDGTELLVDVIGTDETEQLALLSYMDEQSGKRGIWVAQRDQSGQPGTWLWTATQIAQARNNKTRIADSENEFSDDAGANSPFAVAPIHKDRRTEILMLGLDLNKTDAEVQQRLRAEGIDDTLPKNYRGTWDIERIQSEATEEKRTTEPLMRAMKKRREPQRIMPKRPQRPVKFSRKHR